MGVLVDRCGVIVWCVVLYVFYLLFVCSDGIVMSLLCLNLISVVLIMFCVVIMIFFGRCLSGRLFVC